MELNHIPQNMEKKAKELLKEVEANWKKLEEKAQPRLSELQGRVDQFLNADLNRYKETYKGKIEKLQADGKQLINRSSTWVENNYSHLLDRVGVATKDEVDLLQKKLVALQKKLNVLKKTKNDENN